MLSTGTTTITHLTLFKMYNFLYLKLSCVFLLFVLVSVSKGNVKNSELVDTYCEGNGWIPYKDVKCVKLIKISSTRQQAKDLCDQEVSPADSSAPQLVSVKSEAEQEYLTKYLFEETGIEVNIWIGAKRVEEDENNAFVWDDGSAIEYTNWAVDSPTAIARRACVVMQSEYTRGLGVMNSVNGKWKDVTCEQTNLVICEKLQRWSIGKLQQTILDTRKNLQESLDRVTSELKDTKAELSATKSELTATKSDLSSTKSDLSSTKSDLSSTKSDLSSTKSDLSSTKSDLSSTKSELTATKSDLSSTKSDLSSTKSELTATKSDLSSTKNDLTATKSDLTTTKNALNQATSRINNAEVEIEVSRKNSVPIGFIYTQLPNEKAPKDIFPSMTWVDVSATYAGVFFRVNGGNAAAFGQVQEDNTPRLEQVFLTHEAGVLTGKFVNSQNSGVSVPRSGWSDGIYTGTAHGVAVFLQFKLSTSEVRPRNMAIRVWKRIL